jgi:hypothetical protein
MADAAHAANALDSEGADEIGHDSVGFRYAKGLVVKGYKHLRFEQFNRNWLSAGESNPPDEPADP